MDKMFDRLGLYDFFGVLIPGMTFSAFLFFMRIPIIKEGHYPSSPTFKVILFVLISYILGTLFQEIASAVDNRFTKMRITPREQFAQSNGLIFSGDEFHEVRKCANNILNKSVTNASFTNYECSMVFFKCKAFLENSSKMGKANKLDAIFAMSRDFIICNICILPCIVIAMTSSTCDNTYLSLIAAYTILSSIIFYYRAKRYSKLRVKTILRQYMDLKG